MAVTFFYMQHFRPIHLLASESLLQAFYIRHLQPPLVSVLHWVFHEASTVIGYLLFHCLSKPWVIQTDSCTISSTDFVMNVIKFYKLEDIYVPCGHFNMLLTHWFVWRSVSCLIVWLSEHLDDCLWSDNWDSTAIAYHNNKLLYTSTVSCACNIDQQYSAVA